MILFEDQFVVIKNQKLVHLKDRFLEYFSWNTQSLRGFLTFYRRSRKKKTGGAAPIDGSTLNESFKRRLKTTVLKKYEHPCLRGRSCLCAVLEKPLISFQRKCIRF